MDELNTLITVKEKDINGVLEEFVPTDCATNKDLKIQFHYIRFQDGVPRTIDFIGQLRNFIPPYCLKRDKLQNITPSRITQLYLEAKAKFVTTNNTGEPGELIVYFLLEGHLKLPKILSKMSLKTNSQMHVHGADGVHLGVEGQDIVLHFGESKLYSTYSAAITKALSSVKEFVSPAKQGVYQTQKDFEINIVTDEIDIPESELRNKVLDVLDPYSAARDNLRYSYTCFIGFDMKELAGKCGLEEFSEKYQEKAKNCYDIVVDKIAKDDVLRSLRWQFFFIPFSSVEDFRIKFVEGLI